MAAPLNPGAVAGLDERKIQALGRAGVDTIEKLASLDVDSVASQSNIAVEELRRMKTQAAALVERPPVAATPARRSMTLAWVILALIVIAVIAVVYAGRVRAAAGTQVAEQEQKLVVAVAHVGLAADRRVESAAANIGAGNWGLAQQNLGRAGDEIAALEQIAPRKVAGKVREARSRLSRAQEAVGAKDRAALERINELRETLGGLSGAGAE